MLENKKPKKVKILLINTKKNDFLKIKKILSNSLYEIYNINLDDLLVNKFIINYLLVIINNKDILKLLNSYFFKNRNFKIPILVLYANKNQILDYKKEYNIKFIDYVYRFNKEIFKYKVEFLIEISKEVNTKNLENSILNYLDQNICIISNNGTIMMVNNAWKKYAIENNYKHENFGIGVNYFDICKKAVNDGVIVAEMVATGIESVLYDFKENFSLEYQLSKNNWYQINVSPFYYNNFIRGAIISHLNITRLKMLEMEIKKSEQYLKTITTNAPNTIIEINTKFEILYINNSKYSFVLGTNILNYISDEFIYTFRASIGEVLLFKKNLSFDIKLIVNNKDEWVTVNCSPLFTDEEEVASIILIFEDINNRKKMEENLKLTTKMLMEAQEIAKIGILKLNKKNEIIYFSEQIYDIFEIEYNTNFYINDLIKKLHKQDQTNFNTAINSLKLFEKKVIELMLTETFIKKHILVILYKELNNIITITIQDISERKKHENTITNINKFVSIKVGNDYLNKLTEFICKNFKVKNASIFRLNEDKTFSLISSNGEISFLEKKEKINISNNLFEEILIKGKIISSNNVKSLLPVEFFNSIELIVEIKFCIIVPIKNNFKTIGFLIILNDDIIDKNLDRFDLLNIFSIRLAGEIERLISEEKLLDKQKQIEETLKELELAQKKIIKQERLKAIGEMASGIAHDFNNNITPILGYTELLLNNKNLEPQKVEKYLQKIKLSVLNASSVVKSLRKFYKDVDYNNDYENTNINELIFDVIELTKHKWKIQAQKNNVYIKFKTELDYTANLYVNPSEIRDVFINLIFNSVDAIENKGEILIKTKNMGDYLCIQVIDTGYGMSQEIKEKVFEPFFTTKKNGTGLGLSMVYGIIKRHQGKIEINSELYKGTCVSIYLPLFSEIKVSQEKKEESKNSIDTKTRILIVENEKQIKDILSSYLELMNISYEIASNGFEGLKKFRKNNFDLIITDYAMPKMNGKQMIDIIRESSKEQPIILLTGFGDILSSKNENTDKNLYIINKPVTIDMLRDTIIKVLNK